MRIYLSRTSAKINKTLQGLVLCQRSIFASTIAFLISTFLIFDIKYYKWDIRANNYQKVFKVFNK
jgi:hypothetical protein